MRRDIALDLPTAQTGHEVLAALWARHKVADLITGTYAAAASGTSAPDVRGIAWLNDHTLIFPRGAADALVSMSADGGETRPVSALAATERTHRWPDVLPGGKAVIFTVGSPTSPDNYDDATIEAVILATCERRVVWRGAAMARSPPTGGRDAARPPLAPETHHARCADVVSPAPRDTRDSRYN